MTGGWSSRESSAIGQFSRNEAANQIHKLRPPHPPAQAEWRASWMGQSLFFFFTLSPVWILWLFQLVEATPCAGPRASRASKGLQGTKALNSWASKLKAPSGGTARKDRVPWGAWECGSTRASDCSSRESQGDLVIWLWKQENGGSKSRSQFLTGDPERFRGLH